MQYVEHCKGIKQSVRVKSKGKQLSKMSLAFRFSSVERLQKTLAGTAHQFAYPWPESSANYLAGIKKSDALKPKTELIPDDVFVRIFQYANGYLQRANKLLSLHDDIEKNQRTLRKSLKFHDRK